MWRSEGADIVAKMIEDTENEESVAQEGFGDDYDNESLAEFCCAILVKCCNSFGDCFKYILFCQCLPRSETTYQSIEEEDTCSRFKRFLCCGSK